MCWEEARALLTQLLVSHQQIDPAGITLSNVKRLFRLHFERELSETVLGHVRLMDLMNDPRLSDILSLHTQKNGQTVVRALDQSMFQYCPAVPPGMWAMPMSPTLELESCTTTQTMPFLALPPASSTEDGAAVGAGQTRASEELISPGASPRGSPLSSACDPFMFDSLQSWPAEGSTTEGETGSLELDSTAPSEGLCSSQGEEEDTEVGGPGVPRQHADKPWAWAVNVKNTFIDCESYAVVGGSCGRQRRKSVPALLRS